MVGIRFVGVGEGERQSEDSFVCYGLKIGNKTRKRKIPKQSTHRSSWQSGKSDGQWEMTAKRGGGTCGPKSQVNQHERMSQRSLVDGWEFHSGARSR